MAVYVWVAQGRAGEVKKGETEAINEAAIRTQLRRQGLKPTRVKEKPKDLLEMIPFRGSVKGKDVVIFSRQFSTMISAGLPLIQCLDILSAQEQNKSFARVIPEPVKLFASVLAGDAGLLEAVIRELAEAPRGSRLRERDPPLRIHELLHRRDGSDPRPAFRFL